MLILFPSHPLDHRLVDSEFQHEIREAREAGFKHNVFDLDLAEKGDEKSLSHAFRYVEENEYRGPAIYRGWMLSANQYATMYAYLHKLGIELINDPTQYKHCHHLPENYPLIRDHSAQTEVLHIGTWDGLPFSSLSLADIQILERFAGKPVILKDDVKSEKGYWKEACFISDSSDFPNVLNTINKFLKLRGNRFTGNLVFREYLELDASGVEPKSGRPLTDEYRQWILKGSTFLTTKYSAGQIPKVRSVNKFGWTPETGLKVEFGHAISAIKSNFFVMDFACLKSGEWVILECGDGQVSGLPADLDPAVFYRTLNAALG